MQINLTGHHVEITPAIRDYINEKLERIQRHFENATDIHVILTVEKLEQKAEATINVVGNTLHAALGVLSHLWSVTLSMGWGMTHSSYGGGGLRSGMGSALTPLQKGMATTTHLDPTIYTC